MRTAGLALLLMLGIAAAQAQDRPPLRPEGAEAPVAKPEVETATVDSETTPETTAASKRPPLKPEQTEAATAADPEGEAVTNEPIATTTPAPADPEPAPQAPDPTPPQISDFDHAACLLALRLSGAEWQEVAPVRDADNPGCHIARPIRLDFAAPGIEIVGGAVMRCDTALALNRWTRETVQPAARHLPGAPKVMALLPGSTYQCRGRAGGGRLSEHAIGSAFDVMGFRLNNGSDLPVQPRQDKGDMTEAFQRAVRGGACLFFTTVLGPGQPDHDDHLHLDLAARSNGWRLCQ
ncbi:MAG: extensin family protein [Paracoccus sp. (in: a-proteobacteria)]|uniref:extensin family protein n=1 Tax=Paracoccus sp. TaxID=267 RepID=UPI0026DEE29A|nr:extensin family protein [Paracoccus sp. (in: a-proteobacteria)]MDO5621226.1 extensin family protein [Paracoccus sp. (in: a-proteobacteria)]